MKNIYVTQPVLPPLEEYVASLEEIWASKVLTNGGPFHQRLEAELASYLGVEYVALFTNATIALVTAFQALGISGEVITTPFSFVATAHSMLWNGIRPVFVDIEPVSLNLDPTKIEAAITPQTTAIMPVHVYGRPCDTGAIKAIADKHGLKVIYDAAHAFGVSVNGQSVLRAGDLSVLSFHATKVFNTFEGGAIICPDSETKRQIDFLKNFGFADEVTVLAPGINGKMSELQAALGLLQLKRIDEAIAARARLDSRYREVLSGIAGLECLSPSEADRHNYSYFPVLVRAPFRAGREGLYQRLREQGIYARRYFYPLISDFPMYRDLPSADPQALPVAHTVASEVLCLPIYPDLEDEELLRVCSIIRDAA